MRALVFSALVASLALAGCGKSGPPKREAGNWKTEMKLVSLDMPGMDAKMKEMAMAQTLPAQTECLSKEAAAKEDPVAEMSKGAGECTFTKKNVSSTVDVAGTCKGPDGKAISMKMTGTFDSKKIDLDVESSGPSPMGNGEMKSKMKITGTHTGAC
jgi:outer membrane murein-binding lipoprotein Lpp